MTQREPERRGAMQSLQTESSPDLNPRDGQIRTVRAKDVLGDNDVVRIDLGGEILKGGPGEARAESRGAHLSRKSAGLSARATAERHTQQPHPQ